MNCSKCGKEIVAESDWGDYDDACNWACSCEQRIMEHQIDLEIEIQRDKGRGLF